MSLEENWSSLRDLTYKAVRRLEKKDVNQIEAFFTSTKTTEVAIRNSEILTQNIVDDSGVGFRVAVAGTKWGSPAPTL